MSDLKEFGINFLVIGLFLVALVSFAVGIASNYGKDESYMVDEKLGYSNILGNLSSTSQQAKSWESVFTGENIFESAGELVLKSIWGVMTLLWGAGFGLFNVLVQGAYNLLGVPILVTSVLMAIIIISLIFSAWSVIRKGE